MEEKNITNQTNEVKQTKPAPQAKAKKKDNDKDTFADYKAATVIVTSFIIGVIIFCMDTVFTAGYSAIIGLLG